MAHRHSTRAVVAGLRPTYKISPLQITTNLAFPAAIAVDTPENVFVANVGGNIESFASNKSFVQTITANAGTPNGIAVDQFDDLFIANGSDLALDGPTGHRSSPTCTAQASNCFRSRSADRTSMRSIPARR